jgi:hypothetical protein
MNSKWMWITGVLVLSAGGATARADQCAVVSKAVAERAARLLQASGSYVPYCEPCGDRVPVASAIQPVRTVEVVPDTGQYAVRVNGTEIDLAYAYYASGADFANLADLAGCDAGAVSDRIRIGVATDPTAVRPQLAGTWLLDYENKFSTCPPKPARNHVTWTITDDGKRYQAVSSTGAHFEGAWARDDDRVVHFRSLRAPSAYAVDLRFSGAKPDSGFGSRLAADPTGDPRDPLCLTSDVIWLKKR